MEAGLMLGPTMYPLVSRSVPSVALSASVLLQSPWGSQVGGSSLPSLLTPNGQSAGLAALPVVRATPRPGHSTALCNLQSAEAKLCG